MAVEWKTLKLEELGRALWKGKVFYRDQRLLRNRIEDTRLLQPLVGSDLGAIPKTTVNGEDQWLLFPAKLYCGQRLSSEARRVGQEGDSTCRSRGAPDREQNKNRKEKK